MNEKFCKTIKEIAEDLNVTKQDVYQIRRSEPLFSELKPHTHKNNGIIYISNEGIALLKQALFPTKTNLNASFLTTTSEETVSIIDELSEQIEEDKGQVIEQLQEKILKTDEMNETIQTTIHTQDTSQKIHDIDIVQENSIEISASVETILPVETSGVLEEEVVFVEKEEDKKDDVSIVPSVILNEKTEPVSDTLLEQLQAVTKFSEMLQMELKSKNKIIATQQNTINELTAIIKSHAQSVHIDKQTAFMKQFLATKLLKPVKLAQNKNTKNIGTHHKNTKKTKATQLSKKRKPRI